MKIMTMMMDEDGDNDIDNEEDNILNIQELWKL